jgi:hypothetical protein
MVNGVSFLEVEDSEWTKDSGRFIASINIAGVPMHLEAFPVGYDEELHMQTWPEEWEELLGAIYNAVGADGGWETTTVCGVEECVLIATPFC